LTLSDSKGGFLLLITNNDKVMALLVEKCWVHLAISQTHALLCSHVYIATAFGPFFRASLLLNADQKLAQAV